MSQNEQKTPSIFKMMRSFTSELTNWIKEGAPNVTPESYATRLDICNGCEKLNKKSMRCMSCGCLLEHKAKWRTADCPESKWPVEEKPPKVSAKDVAKRVANRNKNDKE